MLTQSSTSFNGAATLPPRKPIRASVRSARFLSFNGAATLPPRKPGFHCVWSGRCNGASTEPRRCRRGNVRIGRRDFHDTPASTEPRRCRRGNLAARPGAAGRESASTEPRRCRRGNHEELAHRAAFRAASTEPRRCRRGNSTCFARCTPASSRASTEPRRCRRGNTSPRSERRGSRRASTEPRRCRRGNDQSFAHRLGMLGLQRSRDVAAAETATVVENSDFTRGFNGAATLPPRKPVTRTAAAYNATKLQRSRDVAAAETHLRHHRRLPRVASTEPRRCRRGNGIAPSTLYKWQAASTEPRRCRRGNATRMPLNGHSWDCFNGAATLPPRKRRRPDPQHAGRQASTEPRRCRRGNDGAIFKRPWFDLLQRSRDVAAAETVQQRPTARDGAILLQRSRDVAAAETSGVGAVLGAETRLQRSRDVAAAETLGYVGHRLLQTGLQRSRDVAAAETGRQEAVLRYAARASTEPRRCRRGNS